MLEVLPIQTKEEQEEICKKCKVPFRADLLAYKVLVDGELKGMSQFSVKPGGGIIRDLAWVPDQYEFEPMFVLGRATINFIDLCHVHHAFCDAEYPEERLILAIGFSRNENGRYEMDLTDFFTEPCKHPKK